MARFDGKVFVITGGSSGIGWATAERIVAEGGRVLVTGTNEAKLEAVRSEAVQTLVHNAADLEVANALADEARRVFGAIDGAFLNAGIGAAVPLGQITPASYHKLVDLNVGGVLFAAQALAPLIRDGGTILVTSSAAKDKGIPPGALYSATKGAVRAMVRGLARDLAPKRIRVNTISPGPIETPFFERLGVPPEHLDSLRKNIQARNPMGRMGTMAEAAAVSTFLLSDEAGFVNGADYAVDGGETQL